MPTSMFARVHALSLALCCSAWAAAGAQPAPTPYHVETPATPLIARALWERIITLDSASGDDINLYGLTVMRDGGLLLTTGPARMIPPRTTGQGYLIETDNSGNPRYALRYGGGDSGIVMSVGVRAGDGGRTFIGFKHEDKDARDGHLYRVHVSASGELGTWGYTASDRLPVIYTVASAIGDTDVVEASQLYEGSDEEFGNLLLRRRDGDGGQLWLTQSAKEPAGVMSPIEVRPLSDGGYAVALLYLYSSIPNVWGVARFDAAGARLWTRSFDTTYNGPAIAEAPANGLYVFSTEHLGTKAIVTRLDSNGAVLWARGIGGDNPMAVVAGHATADGGLLMVGARGLRDSLGRSIDSAVNFQIMKVSSSGELEWEAFGGRPGMAEFLSLLGIDVNGNFIVVGTMTSAAGTRKEIYIAAIPDAALSVGSSRRAAAGLAIAAAPNPASSSITVTIGAGMRGVTGREGTTYAGAGTHGEATLSLSDGLGNEIGRWPEYLNGVDDATRRIDLSGLPAGRYYLHLRMQGAGATATVTIAR